MTLFEKIHNHKLHRLFRETSAGSGLAGGKGPFIPTAAMMEWLYNAVDNDAGMLDTGMQEKLSEWRNGEPNIDAGERYVEEKGKPQMPEPLNGELYRQLSRMIRSGSPITLTYRTRKGGLRRHVAGLPLRLEFHALRRRWYLVWKVQASRRTLRTPLSLITGLAPANDEHVKPDNDRAIVQETLQTVRLHIAPDFTQELQRIFYVLSHFNKTVKELRSGSSSSYEIHIHYAPEDKLLLLSRLRMLGRHIVIVHPKSLAQEALATAVNALGRYGAGN